MSEQMVIKANVGLEAQDFLVDANSEPQSWGSMSDSGEFAPSDGEVPFTHEDCLLAMRTPEGYDPGYSDSHIYAKDHR